MAILYFATFCSEPASPILKRFSTDENDIQDSISMNDFEVLIV